MAPPPTWIDLWLADLRGLARHSLFGGLAGLLAAALLCLCSGLYPWFDNDALALGLMGLMLALPLACALGAGQPARAAATQALAAGLALSLVLSGVGGHFAVAASWFCAASLLGAALASAAPAAGAFSCALWLMLGALPFFYHRLAGAPLGASLEAWASQGCPWLGFAQAAHTGDPLRKTLLYFGHWTPLSGAPAQGFLTALQLWLLGLLALGVALARPRQAGS